MIDFREISTQSLTTDNTISKNKKKNNKKKNKNSNSSTDLVNTAKTASEKTASLTVSENQNKKNKKNKQKPNSGIPASIGNSQVNLKKTQSGSTPIKQKVPKPTIEKTVPNQSPNKKKKRDKKKNKSNDNASKETVNKNQGKITETVQLAASIKLKNKMKKNKQIGQLNSDKHVKHKHQVHKQGIGNKMKKNFRQKQ